MKNRLTITEVAKAVGVTPRTIMRWEKAGRIKKSKRDWRGWRVYFEEDLDSIRQFYETFYEFEAGSNGNGNGNGLMPAAKKVLGALVIGAAIALSFIYIPAFADAVTEVKDSVNINLADLPAVNTPPAASELISEGVKYTFGPDDVIEIEARRHPEFSGQYSINSEGKIEYKYIGDIFVTGMTKNQLKERITKILADYIIDPDVNIKIVAYLSKVFYVVGEVGRPGKFYMRGDTTTVREALVQAGLPTLGAAMRRCRLVTPSNKGSENFKDVNVYSLLYEGNLKENINMNPGDVLYVPATVMAKIVHVISPVTSAAGQTTQAAVQGASAAAIVAP